MADIVSAAQPAAETVTQTVTKWNDVLVKSFEDSFHQIVQFAPRVVAMVFVLVIGYIIAKLFARILTLSCEKLGLQVAAERSGVAQSMQHMGIKRNVPGVIGTIGFWLVMWAFLMAGFKILELTGLSDAMQRVFNYIPNLLVATVVVVVGLFIASFLRGVIATSADRVGITYADRLATGCYYVLAVLTFYTALGQLGMELEVFKYLILIAAGALAVGFGLAFGLGGRDVVGGILAGYYVRQRLQAGDHVTVGAWEGTVREVGPVATVIETDEHGLLSRHSIPNAKMLNEAVR
jgi:small-conductance mechanosensitive channel